MASIHQKNLRFLHRKILIHLLYPGARHVTKCARGFGAGGTGAHDDEVERPFVDQRRIAISGLKDREDARAQQFGVTQEYNG